MNEDELLLHIIQQYKGEISRLKQEKSDIAAERNALVGECRRLWFAAGVARQGMGFAHGLLKSLADTGSTVDETDTRPVSDWANKLEKTLGDVVPLLKSE